MTSPTRVLLVLAVLFCCRTILALASADTPDCQGLKSEVVSKIAALTFDVVVEDVDLLGNTITAKSCCHVIPPSGSTGGAVYSGHLPPDAKPARYERLPVVPEARLKDKAMPPGVRATLRVDIRKGAMMVVGVEPSSNLERVGIDWLDAPAPKNGR